MDGPCSACIFGTSAQQLPVPGQGKWEKSYLGVNKGFGWLWRLRLPNFHYERSFNPSGVERQLIQCKDLKDCRCNITPWGVGERLSKC